MYSKYSCLDLPATKTQEDLDALISSYASSIYEEFQETDALPDDLDELTDAISAATSTDALKQIETALRTYLKDIHFGANGCSVVVELPSDNERDCSDVLEPFCTFLFSHSGATHFLMRSAAFDRDGAYAHQWIGYWKDGTVVTEHCDRFFQQLFCQGTPALLQPA
jgi:hypothetical protein